MKDFEDALIAHSAERNGMNLILTYSLKDYRRSPIQAMEPATFVKIFEPANLEYAEIELG